MAGAARFHDEVLQSDAVSPGSALALRRVPGNEHGPDAVAVLTSGGAQMGFVPREVAASLAVGIDAGEPWAAVVLRERRASPRNPRTGLTMLLARAEEIVLRDAVDQQPASGQHRSPRSASGSQTGASKASTAASA